MDLDNNPTVLLVRKHLVEHLGPPEEVFEVAGSPNPGSPLQALNLAYFAPKGAQSPVVFATCGASLFRMRDGRRVEALMILNRRPPDHAFEPIRRLLASFALFAEANNEVVQFGDVVRAADELSVLTRMDGVLFVPPFTFLPAFHRVGLSESEAVDLVWLLPVYAAEGEYAVQQGPQALMALFAAQRIDLTDPGRAPVDLTMPLEAAVDEAQRMADEPAKRTGASASRRPGPRGSSSSSIEIEDEQATGITVQRRRPKAAPPPAAAARRRAPVGPRKKREDEVRFDLAKDGLPGASPPPARKAEPTKKPEAAPPAPKLSKAERVAALKKAAKEARERAKARADGTDQSVWIPPSARRAPGTTASGPSGPQRLGAASNRRGAPTRRGGTAPPAGAEDTARAAARRRGAPFRNPQRPTDADDEG